MKKIIAMFMVMYTLISLSCCMPLSQTACFVPTKAILPEQSRKNFVKYKASLKEVTERYGYDFKETEDTYGRDDVSYYEYVKITISPDEVIRVTMENSTYDTYIGSESFSMSYIINKENGANSEKKFDTKLFTELVNCISGMAITSELCDEFLAAPESKYAASKDGFKKLNGELIAKIYPLNFFEDWKISYLLTEEEERMSFGGLTLQLVD